VSNIPDSRHWHLTHELIGKTRQLSFEKSDDMAVTLDLAIWQDQTIGIESLVEVVAESGRMIWSEMPLVSAVYFTTVDEV
jgi:hypothetical protein